MVKTIGATTGSHEGTLHAHNKALRTIQRVPGYVLVRGSVAVVWQGRRYMRRFILSRNALYDAHYQAPLIKMISRFAMIANTSGWGECSRA